MRVELFVSGAYIPIGHIDRCDGCLTRTVMRQTCPQMLQKLQSKRWFSPPPTYRDLAPSASNEAENAMHMTHYHSPIPKSPTCKRHRGQNTPTTEKMEGCGHAVPAHGFLFRPLGHGSARGYRMHRSMPNGWLPHASLGPRKPKPSARMCTVSLFCKKKHDKQII